MPWSRVLRLFVLWCCSQACGATPVYNNNNNPIPDCVALAAADLPSPYVSLPTNITVKPLKDDWQLYITIHGLDEYDPLLCISLETVNLEIRLWIFKGTCEDQNIVKIQLWEPTYFLSKDWTMIQVVNNGSFIVLQDKLTVPISLEGHNVTLPQHTLLRVTMARAIAVALGCNTNCPAIPISETNIGNPYTTADLRNPEESLFLWPGQDFLSLILELQCEASQGHQADAAYMNITQEDQQELVPILKWHKIVLDFDKDNVFHIHINNVTTRKMLEGLQTCNRFTSFQVKSSGEAFVSLTCDPTISNSNKFVYNSSGDSKLHGKQHNGTATASELNNKLNSSAGRNERSTGSLKVELPDLDIEDLRRVFSQLDVHVTVDLGMPVKKGMRIGVGVVLGVLVLLCIVSAVYKKKRTCILYMSLSIAIATLIIILVMYFLH